MPTHPGLGGPTALREAPASAELKPSPPPSLPIPPPVSVGPSNGLPITLGLVLTVLALMLGFFALRGDSSNAPPAAAADPSQQGLEATVTFYGQALLAGDADALWQVMDTACQPAVDKSLVRSSVGQASVLLAAFTGVAEADLRVGPAIVENFVPGVSGEAAVEWVLPTGESVWGESAQFMSVGLLTWNYTDGQWGLADCQEAL